jgi:small subunit ribosomal protein S21
MVEVVLSEGEGVERALKAFKKKVLRAGVLQDLRKRRHYVKPSEARQLKAKEARRRARSKARSKDRAR